MTHDPPQPERAHARPVTPADEADTTLLPEEAAYEAADTPTAVEDYGVTAAEEAADEPLTDRLRRELRDIPLGPRSTALERLLNGDGPQMAEAELIDLTAEEAAMHLVPEQRGSRTVQPRSQRERLELLEAQVTVLLSMARIHTVALQTLAEALERLPTEEPGDAADKINRAAHEAHDLLAALRTVPAAQA